MSLDFEKYVNIGRDLIHLPKSSKPHFSFLIHKRGRILSFGWNNGHKTSPLANKFGMRYDSIHSELAAIKNMNFPPDFLKKLRLVNIRFKKSGDLGYARPCKSCQELILTFGIRVVYYTNEAGIFVKEAF